MQDTQGNRLAIGIDKQRMRARKSGNVMRDKKADVMPPTSSIRPLSSVEHDLYPTGVKFSTVSLREVWLRNSQLLVKESLDHSTFKPVGISAEDAYRWFGRKGL